MLKNATLKTLRRAFNTTLRIFDTEPKRDRAIAQLTQFVNQEKPDPQLFSGAAHLLVDYFARNPDDRIAAESLIGNAASLEQYLGRADAAPFHFQLVRNMIYKGGQNDAEGKFTETISKLSAVYAGSLEAELERHANTETPNGRTKYNSNSFLCGVFSTTNDSLRQASTEAFLRVCENHFAVMSEHNRAVALNYVTNHGNAEQQERLARLRQKSSYQAAEPATYPQMVNA